MSLSRPALLLPLLAGLVALTPGCGRAPRHRLEGSLSVLLDLRYDDAVVEATPEEAAVRFVRTREAGEDTVLKVALSLLGAALDANAPLDLAEATPTGAQRGVVSRNVTDDPLHDFPRLARGTLVLRRSAISGERVPGELHLTFENGTTFGAGRTLFGAFEANVP